MTNNIRLQLKCLGLPFVLSGMFAIKQACGEVEIIHAVVVIQRVID